jgi:hypothetical protein
VSNDKSKNNDNLVWSISFLMWGVGGVSIYFLWNIRMFTHDTAESIFGFVLYVVAFFYVLALYPIKLRVEYWLRKGNSD